VSTHPVYTSAFTLFLMLSVMDGKTEYILVAKGFLILENRNALVANTEIVPLLKKKNAINFTSLFPDLPGDRMCV
jgi:hypothetical protein